MADVIQVQSKTETAMETSQPYPTLSTDGWILSLDKKMDYIFSHYLTSQYHQTTYHVGNVRSLQYSAKEYQSQPSRLASQIKEDLTFLLKPFFDHVNVDVTYSQREDSNGNPLPQHDYEIALDIMHAGYRWTKFKSLLLKDSKFEELVNINQYGTALI